MKELKFIFVYKLIFWIYLKIRNFFLSRSFSTSGLRIGFSPKLIGTKNIVIGKNFYSGNSLWLEVYGDGNIIIGNNVSFSDFVHIGSSNLIIIEDNVLIGSNVLVTDHNHGEYNNGNNEIFLSPLERSIFSKGKTKIKRNVWIGDGVKVLSGVTIGESSIIATNSVVIGDIDDFCLYGGIPAKKIKELKNEK